MQSRMRDLAKEAAQNKTPIQKSYYRIRKAIGLLGILLPVLVLVAYGGLLSSISHYYYTRSAVFFIAILSAFGLFLISYKGYKRDEKTETISDNWITHIAGIAVLIVVLFPTSCEENSHLICILCEEKGFPLFGHDIPWISTVHLVSAAVFLFAMGYMSVYRFTKTDLDEDELKKDRKKRNRNRLYKICGWIVWIALGILILEFGVKYLFYPKFQMSDYDVFIFETVAVFAFGVSWLVKGEAIKDINDLKIKIKNFKFK